MAVPVEITQKLLKAKDAARVLSVSERHVWRLLSSGELRSIKHRGMRLIPVTEIDRWIDQQVADMENAYRG